MELTDQKVSGIHLSPSLPHCWFWRCVLQHQTFTWVLEAWTQVSMLTQLLRSPSLFLERRSHCVDQTSFEVSLFVPRLWSAEMIGVHYYTLYIPFFIFLKNMCSWLSLNREPLLQGVLWSTGACLDFYCTGFCFHEELHQAAFPKCLSWSISPLPCERKVRQSLVMV